MAYAARLLGLASMPAVWAVVPSSSTPAPPQRLVGLAEKRRGHAVTPRGNFPRTTESAPKLDAYAGEIPEVR